MASDLSELQAVDEASISANCQARYDRDEIYTSCGRLLIAVNPYKQLGIYGADAIGQYHGALDRSQLPPHIYSVAASAYTGMLKNGKSQSVIISGESGAGKTESAKYFLEFMANVGKGAGSLHQRVLQTNPVMEAFGNAQTNLNDNSSRFGKFLRLEFTNSGKMCGASLRTYLLEKTRVTRQGDGERNYHVFYHLAAGAPPEVRKAAGVTTAGGWRALPAADAAAKEVQAHQRKFSVIAEALGVLGIGEDQALKVWATVGAVLHACNLAFEPLAGGEGVKVADAAPLDALCRQLGLQVAQAEEALTTRKIKVGAEVIPKPNSAEEAANVRDALARAVFANLFDWIVRQLNGALKATGDAAAAVTGAQSDAARFIGAVDVFGFESFAVNSLEQLCINYANERLQRVFVRAVFESQAEVYKREGVAVPDIPYTDNAKVVALIDGPPGEPGVLQILSEECVLGNSSDESFLSRVQQRFTADKPSPFFVRAKGRGMFAIKHFAAEVAYTVDGFVDKNKDPLPVDLAMLLKFSSVDLVAALFTPPGEGHAGGSAPGGRGAPKFRSAKFVGVIDGFRTSLNELIKTLDATHTHFVRCIKPNLDKRPASYVDEVSRKQLVTSGVVQAVHAARAGFPDHLPFATLANTYPMVVPGYKTGSRPPEGRQGAEAVLQGAGLPADKFRVGKTVVFLAVGAVDFLEARRNEYLARHAVYMQAYARVMFAKREARARREEKSAELRRRKEEEAARLKAEEEARLKAEAERQAREEAEERKRQDEAAAKQQKFNIARQKSFERQNARKKRQEEGGGDAAGGAAEGVSVKDRARALDGGGSSSAGSDGARPTPNAPPKAVVTDQGWLPAAGDAGDDLDEAAALAAAADYGFTNPVAEVLEYAEYLGMDVTGDAHLLWIADEALSAPEPHGWEQRVDPAGNVFYFHSNTGMVLPEHPLDHHYQNLYYQLKETGSGGPGGGDQAGAPDTARSEATGDTPRAPNVNDLDIGPLPVDLGALPASVLLSKETRRRSSVKELWGGLTSRKSARTHYLNLITYELTVRVKRRTNGLGVGLTVDNIVVEMDPNGSFANCGGLIKPNDKIVAIDNVPLGSRMLKDVVRPKEEHDVTVVFSREATQAASERERQARISKSSPSSHLRVKEYSLAIKRSKGSVGFTLDPTNVILETEEGTDAALLLRPGDKVVEVDGVLLEHMRFGEAADPAKSQHKLKVVRVKPKEGKAGGPGTGAGSGAGSKKKRQVGRIQFREVTLSKTSPEERIGVLFHRHDDEFDLSSFAKLNGATLPIIKKVDPDTVGASAGLQAGDVVLAVNGLSGMSNFEVVEMIRTLHGEITFLLAPAPKIG